jgi:hypothetical protein
MNHKIAPEKQAEDYRRLAQKVRERARLTTEKERDELLSRAKVWDYLADHCHRIELNE